MNKIAKYIGMSAMLLCGMTLLPACDDDLAQAPIVMPAEEIGDGTWENPLQAWQANLGTTVGDRTTNWVTGYIVGWIDTSVSNTMSAAKIGTPCSVNTNMIIAQYPYDEEEWAKMGYTLDDCATVQLPSGAVRTALNLVDNPNNFNKQVSLRGTTGSKYCGQYGVRSANDYNWGPKGRYEEPIKEIEGSYFCNFTASRDINYYLERGWSSYMISGGLSGWYWKENSGVDFLTTSAYLGTAAGGPYENWLISPAFDLDKADAKTLSFSSQAGNAADSSLEVYIMTHKNPRACEPIKLNCVLAQAPASSYSAWTKSGTIDLSDYSGVIYIGFRYWSAHGGSGNSSDFGITDFNLGNANPEDWEVIDPATIGTFRKVDTITSGDQYIFVFGDKVVMPLGSTLKYGNFQVKDITKEDGVIRVSKNYAFTLTESETTPGEYTMVDPDGRYVYMYGVYTNFNVSATVPSSGQWWTLTPTDGLFAIHNISRDLTLYYDSAKNYIATKAPAKFTAAEGAEIYRLEK